MLHDARLGAVRDPVVEQGWVRLPRYATASACEALRDRGDHQWQPMAEQVGVVRQSGWYCQPPVDALPAAARAFVDGLVAALGATFDGLGFPPTFNEVTWQRQDPGAGFVGPHRDQSVYTGVVAVLTLVGSARFSVLASREPPVEIEAWDAEAGDLVLLRGRGLGGPDAFCPWHEVGPPSNGPRETLTLRHTVGQPGGWDAGAPHR